MDKIFGAVLYRKVKNSDSEQGIVLSAINPEESISDISQTGYVYCQFHLTMAFQHSFHVNYLS